MVRLITAFIVLHILEFCFGPVLSLALFSFGKLPFISSTSSYATVAMAMSFSANVADVRSVESVIGVLMCGLSASFLFAIVTRLIEREARLPGELAKP